MFTGILYIFVGAGMGWFGCQKLKEIRNMQDIPTSKIRSAAMGSNVEIKCRIVNETGEKIIAPLSGKPCAFYYISIMMPNATEETAHFRSQESFLLEDGSGSNALVELKWAKVNFPGGAQVRFRGPKSPMWFIPDGCHIPNEKYTFDAIPPRLKAALEQHKQVLWKIRSKASSRWGDREIRFHEFTYPVNAPLYVLGFAESPTKNYARTPKSGLKLSFKNFLKAKKLIQSDEKLQKKFDTNQDGHLDPNELEEGAKQLGRKLQGQSLEKPVKPLPKYNILFRGTKLHKLFISSEKEEHLTREWVRIGYGALALYGLGIVVLGVLVFTGVVIID